MAEGTVTGDDAAIPPEPEKLRIREILADPAVRTIIGCVFIVMLGYGIILPILPLFARSFGVSRSATGFLISSFAIARLVFDLVGGPIVDRYGERATAVAGILFVAVTSVATGLAPNFALAVLFRGIGGAGSAVLFSALFSYLLKVVPSDRMGRTLSVFYGSFNVGVIAGGPIGGFVAQRFGLRAPLHVYAILLLVSGLLFWRYVKDPAPRATGAEPRLTPEEVLAEREMPLLRRTRARMGALLRRPGFVMVVVVNLAYLWMVGGFFDTLVPLFGAEEIGLNPAGIGVVFSVTLAMEFVVLFPAGALADRIGRKPVMVPALAALAASMAVLGFAPGVIVFGAILAVVGLASGFAGVPPAAMLSDVTPEEASGTAIGMFRFAGDLGFVFGPLLGGWAAQTFGFEAAFAVSTLPILVALALVVRTPETLELRRARQAGR
ncbi:MAG TPA: MFS transporter [Candidatus Acidoferrum sp.]|nr:MFS transporter [Candidatus Acidoferrum sp.]